MLLRKIFPSMKCSDRSGANAQGAIVSFVGLVREEESGRKIKSMEMEAYKGMAEEELSNLKNRAMEKFSLEDVAIIHRVGSLLSGDNMVLIAVSSGHRKETFA